MNSLSNVIDQISNILKDRPASISPEVVAEQYQTACETVNSRLSRIETMLGNNSDIEALQVAEESPSLMRLVELLSFGDEVAWQEYCETNGHAVAPLIEFRKVDALAALYEKGLSPNHPLYRDYRAAIRSRDDDKALELLSIISRLNPSDTNAVKEIHRLGRKGTIVELERLKTCLDAGSDEELVAIMAKIEVMAPDDEHQTRPEWKTALSRRRAYEKRMGRRKMGEIIELAEDNLTPDSWRTAAAYEAEILQLGGEHGFPSEDRFPEKLQAITKVLTQFRDEAAKEAEVRKIVRKLESLAEEVETRGVTPEGLTVDYATSSIDVLRRQERELIRLGAGVPGPSRSRINTTAERLEEILRISRSRKKMGNGSIAAIIAVLLSAGAGFGFVALQASSYRGELEDAVASESVQRAKSLVESADRSGLIFRFPSVVSTFGEAEQWVSNRIEEAVVAETLLSDLELGARSGFSGHDDAVALLSWLETCGKLVSEVVGDLRAPLESRYAIVRNEGESRLFVLQELAASRAIEFVESSENFSTNVDYNGYANKAGEGLAELLKRFRSLEPLLEQQVPLLRLPVNVASALKSSGAKIEEINDTLKAIDEQYRSLTTAADLDAFRVSLSTLAETQFADAGLARAIDAAIPNIEKIKANLLTSGNVADYKIAVSNSSVHPLVPMQVNESDREWVKNLRGHLSFSDVYRIKHSDWNGFSHGLPQENKTSVGQYRYEMDFTEIPTRRSELPTYKNISTVTNDELNPKISEASALLNSLNLFGFLDNSGTRFERSAVEFVDIIYRANSCPALARSYLLGQVFQLIRKSETQWGVFLSPNLMKDMDEYKDLSSKFWVMPSDWMMKDGGESATAWDEYFSSRNAGSRSNEIAKNSKVVSAIERAGIGLCGHVNRAGEIELRSYAGKGIVLGIATDDSDKSFQLGVAGTLDGKTFEPRVELARSSPLMFIELDGDVIEFILSINPVGKIFN